jgi:hypothetical protein
VARAQIAVSSWDFLDSIQEIKVNNELFITRVVEERFGETDLGITREAYSKVEEEGSISDLESVGRVGEDQSNHGWEDGLSDGVSGEEDCGVRVSKSAVINREQVTIVTGERETEPLLLCTAETRLQKDDGDRRVLELVEEGKGEGIQIEFLTKDVELVERSLEVEREVERRSQSRNEEVSLVDKGIIGLQEDGGTSLTIISNVEEVCGESGPAFVQREGKKVLTEEREVDFKKVSLLKGTGSKWAVGPNNTNMEAENICIRRLKLKEVAQLDWELKNLLFPSVTRNKRTENIKKKDEDKRKGGELQKRLAAEQCLLSKSCRFAQAVRGGAGGRKGETNKKKRKGKRDNKINLGASVESISSASFQGKVTEIREEHNSIEDPVEFEEPGESGYNKVYDKNSEMYRMEANRLFNIGANLGCTSNEERITMIERLIDLETKDFGQVVGVGDEEVDQ